MTTPAENYMRTYTAPTNGFRWDGTSWVPVTAGDVMTWRESLARPASVSVLKRSDGTRPPFPYYRVGFTSRMPLVEWGWSEDQANVYRWYFTGPPPGLTIPIYADPVHLYPARNAAVGKALKRVKDSKVNLGVALAEARSTATMLSNTVRRMTNIVNDFRRGNPKKVWRDIVNGYKIPGSWLEIQYGWSPLLSDILGSAQALAEAQSVGRRFKLTVSGTGRDQIVAPAGPIVQDWPSGFELVSPSGWELTTSTKVVLCYELPSSMLPALSTLGLTNPAELIWEKLPYSFALDWVLPVGDWLSTLDAGAYLYFIEGSVSEMTRLKTDLEVRKTPIPPTWRKNLYVNSHRKGYHKSYRFTRTVLGTPPSFDYPSLRNPLRLGVVANALALLSQAFSKPWKRGYSRI